MDINSESFKNLDDPYVQALLLAEVIKRIFLAKADVSLSWPPKIELKPVSEFMKRMRVSSLDKFDNTTYISAINFYQNASEMEKHNTLGAMVLYIEEDYMVWLLRRMDYPPFDEDDADALKDACGTLCNLIAGKFKAGLSQLGYCEVEMSPFLSYKNEVVNGVEFNPHKKEKYEITFDAKGTKRIVVDLNMASMPKKDI